MKKLNELTAAETDQIFQNDQRIAGKINEKADTMAKSKMLAIQEKGEKLKEKFQELIDKKHEIFRAPICKAETLALAKKTIKEKKREIFFDGILVKHLGDCQNKYSDFFSELSFRTHLLKPENVWKLIYYVLTDEDIEKAAEKLPDIGLSSAERATQIDKIDAEIATVEAQIEKELAKV